MTTLAALTTPCLLLEDEKLQANMDRLARRLHERGVSLRPHLKTCKIARRCMESPSGPATVSTLAEAEYFAAGGVHDICYAVGIAPNKLERVAELRRRGIDLSVVLDNEESARLLVDFARQRDCRLAVLLEIDCDGHRAGLRPDDPRLTAIAALLRDGGCTHISAYLLKVEPGTAFYRNPPAGLPDADAAADFYLYAVRQLEAAGYRQYEISNFARPGHEGRHNLLYWNCSDYWGVGPAAHSCVGNVRRFWPGDVQGFIDGTIHEEIEGDCTAEDYLLMQLRLTRGLDLEEYARRGGHFTAAQQAFMRQCITHGYAVWEGSSFRLTPAGMVVQNAILTELI